MAERTEGSIDIAATPTAILAVVTDFDAYPDWAGMVKKIEVQDRDDQGRGTKVRFEVSAVGMSGWYVLSYDYSQGEKAVSWTFLEGSPMKDLQGEYIFEPAAGGTHVTYRAAVEIGIPMIGLIKRQVNKMIIDTALKGLKKRVESTN